MVSRKLNKRNIRQKGKKETSKLIKCKICNKSKRISRKNFKKLRNAGMKMNDVYKYICCGENSDAIEESTIKPIDESKIQFYTFNSQGKYKPLPRLEADKREEMKRLYFSNKVNGWTIAPPQPVMLYDSNKNLEPVYRTLKGRDDVDLETMPFYNTPKIKKLPVVGNLGEKRSTHAAVKKVKPDKNQTAKKKKRRISVPMLRF